MSGDGDQRPTVLSVHRRGTPEFPRYVISDERPRYWQGSFWTEDETKALVFCDVNDACGAIQQIHRIEFADMPLRRFHAPIYLDLYASQRIPLRDLHAWVVKATRLLMDASTHGDGPMEGTLGLIRIEWDELTELRPGETR